MSISMKKKTKPAVSGNKRNKPSPTLVNRVSKLTKSSSAALFSAPLRGEKVQKIASNSPTETHLRQEGPLFPIVGIGKKGTLLPKMGLCWQEGPLFPIVGIGASAGGLEALEQFLRQVPENSGVAFVIVQHLDPTHKGIMPELLQRVTGMKVFQVSDRMRVKPNCVYVIPPNKDMSILHGVLHLFEPTAPRGLRLPIDFFLRSLPRQSRFF